MEEGHRGILVSCYQKAGEAENWAQVFLLTGNVMLRKFIFSFFLSKTGLIIFYLCEQQIQSAFCFLRLSHFCRSPPWTRCSGILSLSLSLKTLCFHRPQHMEHLRWHMDVFLLFNKLLTTFHDLAWMPPLPWGFLQSLWYIYHSSNPW